MSKVTRLAVDSDRRKAKDNADADKVSTDTIGGELKAARMRQGEDVVTIEQALRIRKEHLEAIEAGNFAALPGRTYGIGFVRAYAEHLGLDPVAAVKRFKSETGTRTEPAELVFPDAADEAKLSQGTTLLLALLLAAGIFGGWYFSVSMDREVANQVPSVPERLQPAATTPTPAPAPAKPQFLASPTMPGGVPASVVDQALTGAVGEGMSPPAPGDDESAGDTTLAAASPTGTDAEAPVAADGSPLALPASATGQVYGAQHSDSRILVVARADTWLRIEDQTGKVYINRNIRTGDAYRVPNRPGLILIARDAGTIDLFVDGAGVGAAGPTGMVLTGMPLNPRFLQTRGQPQ